MNHASAISRAELAAAMSLGSVALLMIGLQPLLLGELVATHRITLEGVGLVAMGEIVGLGCGVLLGDVIGSRATLRTISMFSALLTACLDIMTTMGGDGDFYIAAVRSLAGLAEGLVLWGTVSLIVRAREPDRSSGVFVVVQTIAQAVIAAALASWIIPGRGVNGGFELLAILSMLSIILVFRLPVRLPMHKIAELSTGPFVFRIKHGLLLGAVFCQFAALGAMWAYMESLGSYAGLNTQDTQLLISGVLFMQVVGGCLGVVLVRRLSEYRVLIVVAIILVAIALGVYWSTTQNTFRFSALAGLFGVVYLMLTPFQIRLALALDPGGRVAVLVPGMQLLGSAFGPLVGSLWVVDDYAQPVTLVSAVFSLVTLGLILMLRKAHSHPQASFKDKVVLIVGASSGIGRVMALRMAAEGASVIATARRADRLEALKDEVVASGGHCETYAVDAQDDQAAARVVSDIVARHSRLDVVLLNAGGAPALDLRNMSARDVTGYMRSNYDVAVNYLFPVLAQMSQQRSGLVAHTNSLAGFLGVPLQGPYSAAKGALRLLVDTCRLEFHGRGISFVSLYPGFVATEQTANDGMPAVMEISEAQAADYMIAALRGRKPEFLFPWRMRWLVRLSLFLPKWVTFRTLLRDVPPLPEDHRPTAGTLSTSGKSS